MIRNCFIALVLLLFISCDRNVIFEKNVELPDNHWEVKNVVDFETDIQDTVTPHNLYINLRNAGGYPFSNIFLFFTTSSPSGKMERDTVELTLADPSGKWLGNGLGDIWDNRVLFKENFRFPEKGVYKFALEQAMRVDPLPQIMDVGIRIEKVNAN
jgi:gliding motility-associated lipoprotein GldH